jgi:hypothetical protein
MDTEFVGGGIDGKINVLAKCTIINYNMDIVLEGER